MQYTGLAPQSVRGRSDSNSSPTRSDSFLLARTRLPSLKPTSSRQTRMLMTKKSKKNWRQLRDLPPPSSQCQIFHWRLTSRTQTRRQAVLRNHSRPHQMMTRSRLSWRRILKSLFLTPTPARDGTLRTMLRSQEYTLVCEYTIPYYHFNFNSF